MDKINYTYTISLAATISVGFFVQGYWFGWFNNLTLILHRQYVHNGSYVIGDRDWFNSIISALIPIGAILGAPLGGPLASIGRRKAVMAIALLFTFSWLISWIFNFFWLLLARFLMGFCVGVYASISPMYISEIAPKSIAGPLGASNQLMSMVGTTVAYLIGFTVPLSDDINALTTKIWMFTFLFPGIITFIQFLLVMFVYRYDTPVFYEINKDRVNYQAALDWIYTFKESNFKELMDDSDHENEKEAMSKPKEVSWGEVIQPPYQKALFVGIVLGVLHQATGINSIVFYSNEIFIQGTSGSEAEVAARRGTFLIGVFGIIGALTAMALLNRYGRRILTLVGLVIMGNIHGDIFILSLSADYRFLIKYFIIMFIFFFNSTFGSVLWLYAPEILVPKGMSLVSLFNMIAVLFFGSMANILFKVLTPSGMYMWLPMNNWISE